MPSSFSVRITPLTCTFCSKANTYRPYNLSGYSSNILPEAAGQTHVRIVGDMWWD